MNNSYDFVKEELRRLRKREFSNQIIPLQAQLELLTQLQKARPRGVDYSENIAELELELFNLREIYFSLI